MSQFTGIWEDKDFMKLYVTSGWIHVEDCRMSPEQNSNCTASIDVIWFGASILT